MKKWEAEQEIKEAELETRKADLAKRRADWEERNRKREAERELPTRRSSGPTFFHRKRCFECGSTSHFRDSCTQWLGKTTRKSEANVTVVGVGILPNEPVIREQSFVASACKQDGSDFGIASLFDCGRWHNTSVNGCDLDDRRLIR